MVVSVSWERTFWIWHYSVSYSQLLFRSLDANTSPTRIDLLFSNVERMELDPAYESFAVEEVVARTDPRWADIRKPMRESLKLFMINGGPDLVIATHCQWHEDDGDAMTPSRFGPLRHTD